ncbi:hypothetical protein HMI51_44320, partial [Corallococcus coralloides]|nr:hypothetical protein [Corallococcus coralloides]
MAPPTRRKAEDGRVKRRSFSVRTYGEEQARKLAYELRKTWLDNGET